MHSLEFICGVMDTLQETIVTSLFIYFITLSLEYIRVPNTLVGSDITLYIDHSLECINERVPNTLIGSDFTPSSNHSTGVIDKKSELHSF